ncbi:MAG TPA: alpha/beta hydrolase [Bryobacteraceae bacterium]
MSSPADSGYVHRFEAATNPAAPTLLLLHGGGGDEGSLLPLGRAVAPGAALLSLRGNVFEHGMARFFRRLPEGIFDQQELEVQTAALSAFLDAAAKTYAFSLGRLVAVGFSNGANMAASLLLTFPAKLAGAVVMRGMAPFVPEPPPDLQHKPVLLLGGIDDPIVGTDEVAELAKLFRSAHADITLHWERAGHILSQGDVLMAFDWLRRFYETQRPLRAQ